MLQYALYYLLIGLFFVAWDVRKLVKIVFWKIRFWKTEEHVAALAFKKPKPHIDWWNMPQYVREKRYGLAVLFILFWPLRLLASRTAKK